ncbi:MAG TPA: bifunctional phosphopantothenoylcysteine decarboxylase/phosphopantothenate--cysteine ligase CoaBC [Halomicronema sp.]
MKNWDFAPPPASELGDHDVPLDGYYLKGKKIALLICGGIAAIKAPMIARALRKYGADVVAFTSKEALRYTTIDALEWSTTNRVITKLTAAAEHLSDSAPFDAYLVAPATYNTINKMALGIADSVITSALGSAIGRMEKGKTKILVVPTMHGSLHNSILTDSLKKLDKMGVIIVPPRQDYGKDNIPSEIEIVAEVSRAVSDSKLKNVPVLVTGGPTPVKIDSVRVMTNIFTGQLGINIASELYFRGADVTLIHGYSGYQPPSYLPHKIALNYDEYLAKVMAELSQKSYQFGIFTAAVADYKPENVLSGKTPSGGVLKQLNLTSTLKVIEEVRAKFTELFMITFKYQEGISHEELMEIAQTRLERYNAVVANRGEEKGPNGEQIVYLVTGNNEVISWMGKKEIARGLVSYMEGVF